MNSIEIPQKLWYNNFMSKTVVCAAASRDSILQTVYPNGIYVGRKLPKHIENRVCEQGLRGDPPKSERKETL